MSQMCLSSILLPLTALKQSRMVPRFPVGHFCSDLCLIYVDAAWELDNETAGKNYGGISPAVRMSCIP